MDGINGWEVVLFLLALIGCIGSIVPALPGLPLAVAALVGYAVISGFQAVSISMVLIALGLSGIAAGASYILGSLLSQRYGEVKVPPIAILAGSILGLIIFGPLGFIIGPVLMALLLAIASGASLKRGIRSAVAVAVSMIASSIFEFILSGWIVYVLFSRIFF